MTRTFESGPARREATFLAFAIVGYSGSGKTKSALRMAEGMRRVKPGPTFVVDTNLKRALHHAPRPGEPFVPGLNHDFIHVPMAAPFSPDDFGHAFAHCIKQGAARIIVDSMSDEHEGDGGVLEWHEAEIERMAKGDPAKALKVSRAAWKAPKDAHKRLRLWMWQQSVDWILCYRAKDKQDENQKPLGMQPVGGADVIFDLLFSVLLPPKGDGRPVWTSYDGNQLTHAERQLTKMPAWFNPLFSAHPQLNEDIGEQLARWATGGDVSSTTGASPPAVTGDSTRPGRAGLAERFDACATPQEYAALDAEMRRDWESIPKGAARTKVTEAFNRAKARVQRAPQTNEPPAMSAEEQAEIDRIERQERQTT